MDGNLLKLLPINPPLKELEKAVKAVDTKEDDEMERRLKALQN